ncbi:hypothetical protein [Polymorphobacter sp.]|uniref:hypothetical protein n=1 Tax=Polymorphobacter sp. TaxID=1909290 RepID=UPI003F71CA49
MADRKPSEDPSKGHANQLGGPKGKGPDEYGGSFAGGQSAGGPYANARQSKASGGHDKAPDEPQGGHTEPGYFGGGQAGNVNDGADDHHAARRATTDQGGSYKDHPSQTDGPENAAFKARAAAHDAAHERDETIHPDKARHQAPDRKDK